MFQLLLAPVHKVRYLLLGASQHLCGLPVAQFFKIDQKKCLPVFLFELAQCGVQLLVLGYPRNMDGTEGPRAQLYRDFAAQVAQATGSSKGSSSSGRKKRRRVLQRNARLRPVL